MKKTISPITNTMLTNTQSGLSEISDKLSVVITLVLAFVFLHMVL